MTRRLPGSPPPSRATAHHQRQTWAHGQTKLVDGVLKRVEVVRGIVGDDITVTGVLCFIDADWPLIGRAVTTRGVEVLWPRKLYPRLAADGSLTSRVDGLHQRLAAALPPA